MDIAGTDMYAVADEDGFMEPEATGNHIPPQAAPQIQAAHHQAAPQIPAVQPIHTPIQQQIAPQAQAVAPVTYSITRIQGSATTKIDEVLDRKKRNWDSWSQSIYILFDLAEVTEYIEGNVVYPNPMIDPVGAKNWRYNDTYAKMLITNNIDASEKIHTRGCTTSRKMWKNLRTIYESTSYFVQTDRFRDLCGFRATETTDISEHLVKLKEKWDGLTFFRKKHNLIMSDAFFKCMIAALLPRSWDDFTKPYVQGYIDDDEDNDPKRKLDSQQFMGIIKQEYELNESRKQGEKSTRPSLASRISAPDDKEAENQSSQNKPKKHCKHCKRDGHLVDKCHFLGKNKCRECGRFGHDADKCQTNNDNKRPYKGKNNNSYPNKRSKREANDAKETADSENAMIGELVVLDADLEANVADKFDNSVPISMNDQTNQLYHWLADTGTTNHITNSREIFATYTPLNDISIAGVGPLRTNAVGKGTIYLQSRCDRYLHTIELNNALHVPENRNNLLSLGRWEQAGRSITLSQGNITLLSEEGNPIARGNKLRNSLYSIAFQYMPTPRSYEVSFLALSQLPDWEEWHQRFGHVGYTGL